MANTVPDDSRALLGKKPHVTKHWGLAGGAMLLLVTLGLAIWSGSNRVAFDANMQRLYDAALPQVARSIVAATVDVEPLDSTEYGALLGRACTMCHGATLSGGPMPGAPASAPIPSNLTPHPTGLKSWSYSDFDRLLTTRVRKNGKPLDPAMPTDAFAKYDDRQKHALWAYLRSIPARPFGQR